MRAVVQRVRDCSVDVSSERVGAIESGLLVYAGFESGDGEGDLRYMAEKILNLRIFADGEGKMNLSLLDVGEEILVVSQFTLHADTRKGRRPSYGRAAAPAAAEPLYERFLGELAAGGLQPQRGRFGAHMMVSYTNDGPVTILLDSKKLF